MEKRFYIFDGPWAGAIVSEETLLHNDRQLGGLGMNRKDCIDIDEALQVIAGLDTTVGLLNTKLHGVYRTEEPAERERLKVFQEMAKFEYYAMMDQTKDMRAALLAEYKGGPAHQFLNASQGMSGHEILIKHITR